ncbi:MAG: glycosyltransferase family 9 protein [Solirubrobacteraceae bacterium]|nr:glycosyltransferase family 9 protein [Solirubrobacteraceae bacterium]
MSDSRVIIYRLGSLGDTVTALPAFHLIERAYPDAERLVLTNVPISSKAAPLEVILSNGGFIHGAIPYPLGIRDHRELRQLASHLRSLRARTLIYIAASRGLPQAWRDVAYFRFCGFRKIIGAPITADRQENRVGPDGTVERECERIVRNLGRLGTVDLNDRAWWDLRLTAAEHDAGVEALGDLVGQPFIAVNTGGKAIEKDWGEPNWQRLLSRLAAELPRTGLVFVGAQEDSERALRLGTHWSSGPVRDLCGALAPRESAAALARAQLFIGHDSGPFHLADSVGTPAIGIFGDYNLPRKWHPMGQTTRVIHQLAGLATITPDEVASTAAELIPAARL